jgi:hypothetical protein
MIHYRPSGWRADAAYACRAFILVVCVALGALLPMPAAASAAITLGATAPGAPGSCVDDGTYVRLWR